MTLNDLRNLENKVKVIKFKHGLCFALGPFQMTLNDICDLENEVKVTRFYSGLRLALVSLCTKFSETISSDIKQKPL